MGDWKFTMPDGSQYNATADSWEEAQKGVSDQVTQDRIDASKKAYSDAPITTKALMLVGDPINQVVHGLTAGLFDKGFDAVTGAKSAEETQASADRLGPGATTLARAGGAMMLPSAAPRAVAAVGGGPLVRNLVGAGTAGVEGGVYGGINAATSPIDPMTGKPSTSIPAGVLSGAVGGAIAQPIANAIGTAVNAGVKSYRGINDAAPPNSMTVLPTGKTPSPMDYVNVAAARAEATGAKKGSVEATQQAQRDEFAKLLTGKASKVTDPVTGKVSNRFTPTQKSRMEDIVYGDPGTRISETGGDLLKNKLVASIFGAGTGAASGGVIPGLATTGATMGAGKILTADSAKATQEAVDRLRQLIYKKTPFRGPMSADRIRTLAQGFGYGGMTGIEDYEE